MKQELFLLLKEGINRDVSKIKFTSSLENINSIDNIAFEKVFIKNPIIFQIYL